MNPLILKEQVQLPEPNQVSRELADRIAYLEQQAETLLESMRYAGSLQRSILPNERSFQSIFSAGYHKSTHKCCSKNHCSH